MHLAESMVGTFLVMEVNLKELLGVHLNLAGPITTVSADEQLVHVHVAEKMVAYSQAHPLETLLAHDTFYTSVVEVEMHHESLNIVHRDELVLCIPRIVFFHVIDSKEILHDVHEYQYDS